MKKYALIGRKLCHSYSKQIHTRFIESNGIDAEYSLIEIEPNNLKSDFLRIKSDGFCGINVTIPYKTDVMSYLTDISSEARSIGAVNTIKFDGKEIIGYNTDYMGFAKTLENNSISIGGKRVVILGTGGASKAVCAVCRDQNASEITYVSRSKTQIDGFRVITYDDKLYGDVLINATPVGMYPNTDKSPLKSFFQGFEAVVDLIYNPSKTLLLKQAETFGAKVVNGLYMLVSQAIYSQSIWNQIPYDENTAEKIYYEMKSTFEKSDNK